MSKPTKTQQVIMIARAAADPALDAASRADLDAALAAAERGASIGPAVARALAAARSRAFEAVGDAALAANAEGAPRSARSALKRAVAAAAAVRDLENRLSGDQTDLQNHTAAGAVDDVETDTAAASSAEAGLHDKNDIDSGADWHAATDTEEVSL